LDETEVCLSKNIDNQKPIFAGTKSAPMQMQNLHKCRCRTYTGADFVPTSLEGFI